MINYNNLYDYRINHVLKDYEWQDLDMLEFCYRCNNNNDNIDDNNNNNNNNNSDNNNDTGSIMYCTPHSLSLFRFCLHQCTTTTITITRAPAAIARRVTATAMATATEVSSVGSRGTPWYDY